MFYNASKCCSNKCACLYAMQDGQFRSVAVRLCCPLRCVALQLFAAFAVVVRSEQRSGGTEMSQQEGGEGVQRAKKKAPRRRGSGRGHVRQCYWLNKRATTSQTWSMSASVRPTCSGKVTVSRPMRSAIGNMPSA